MSADYISLAALAQNMDVYERLPVRIQGALRESIRNTVTANLVSIPILLIMLATSPYTAYEFFQVTSFTAYTAVAWFSFGHAAAGFLLTCNAISLVTLLLVGILSSGLTAPVAEGVHWLAYVAAFASAISLVSAVILGVITVGLFVMTLLVWCVLAIVCLFILLTFAGGGRR